MWFKKKVQELSSEEYAELKALCSSLKIQVASLEASFSNLTNQVLRKIRTSRAKIEEAEEEAEKEKTYKDVMLKEP